jgi:uroporphyrinogen-III decarboxylase
MRTYENIYIDMYQYPDEFCKLSHRIADVMKIIIERACRMGVTALYIQEDLAINTGLAMSPAMIKEFCFAYIKDFFRIAEEYDKPVLFHCIYTAKYTPVKNLCGEVFLGGFSFGFARFPVARQ